MASTDLYVGDTGRNAYFDASPSNELPDLSGVTSATATIEYPGGARVEWTLTIDSQSSLALAVKRALVTNDLPFAGVHKVWLHLVTNAGTYDTETATFTVYSR
jgi:hypothetical protein